MYDFCYIVKNKCRYFYVFITNCNDYYFSYNIETGSYKEESISRYFYLIRAYTRLFLVTGTASREKEDATNRRAPPGI